MFTHPYPAAIERAGEQVDHTYTLGQKPKNNMSSPSSAQAMCAFSVPRATAATLTIFVTTADDALWLIPFISSSVYSAHEKAIHALTFIFTLQFVVVLSIILSNATKLVVNKKIGDTLPFVGATLAWLIAVYLYVRTIMKKRRRRKKEEESGRMKNTVSIPDEESIAIKLDGRGYGSADNKGSNEGSYEDSGIAASSSSSSSSSSSKVFKVDDKLGPVTVFTLTLLGALDELTYFPSVLIGGTFTGVDLAIGAFVSCTVILIIIAYLLSTFQPILELMDKIPLYGVVAVFATILTVEAWNETIEQG